MIVDASAQDQISRILEPHQLFRVSIEAGGCQGFEKKFEITNHLGADDVMVNHQVVSDAVSLDLIGNATLSYVRDLQGSRFELKIPQAASECGCGMSFDLK